MIYEYSVKKGSNKGNAKPTGLIEFTNVAGIINSRSYVPYWDYRATCRVPSHAGRGRFFYPGSPQFFTGIFAQLFYGFAPFTNQHAFL